MGLFSFLSLKSPSFEKFKVHKNTAWPPVWEEVGHPGIGMKINSVMGMEDQENFDCTAWEQVVSIIHQNRYRESTTKRGIVRGVTNKGTEVELFRFKGQDKDITIEWLSNWRPDSAKK
ncbi:MAG: hypothetical protein ACOY6K_00475 [Pseudomonadota bacterium]